MLRVPLLVVGISEFFRGESAESVDSRLIGRPGRARAPMLLLVNAGTTAQNFHLPGGVWQCLLDTSDARGDSRWHGQGDADLPVAAHSLQLLAAAGAGVTGAS